MRALRSLAVYACVLLASAPAAALGKADATARTPDRVYLIIRTDDVGMLDALTSHRFTRALKARNVLVITYRALVAREGLKSMRRPVG